MYKNVNFSLKFCTGVFNSVIDPLHWAMLKVYKCVTKMWVEYETSNTPQQIDFRKTQFLRLHFTFVVVLLLLHYFALLFSPVQSCSVLFSPVQFCSVMLSPVQSCSVLFSPSAAFSERFIRSCYLSNFMCMATIPWSQAN